MDEGSGRGSRARVAGAVGATIVGVSLLGALALGSRLGPAGTAAPTDARATAPGETHPVPATAAAWRDVSDEALGLGLTLPADWSPHAEYPDSVPVTRWRGPGAWVSTYHGPASVAGLCDPDCTTIALPVSLPFDPERTLATLELEISARTDTSGWTTAASLNSRITNLRVLDVTDAEAPGMRQTYVIGMYLTGLVVAATSVPDDARGAALASTILEGLRPFPNELYPVGVPVQHVDVARHYQVDIPDVWGQGGLAAAGTSWFGKRRMSISVGDPGDFVVCDPLCRSVAGTDAAALERSLGITPGPGITIDQARLSDAPARSILDRSGLSPSYRVFGVIDGTPIHLWFDLRAGDVDLDVLEQIVASFQFTVPTVTVLSQGTVSGPGFSLSMPPGLASFPRRYTRIDVAAGDSRDRLWVCLWGTASHATIPCSIEHATTLQALDAALPMEGSRTEVTLGGEPAYLYEFETYEPVAKGGQWLAYILAVHEGRPFVIRLQNSWGPQLFVNHVLDSFRFTETER